MKRIVIFCDGTWNSPVMQEPTSVVRLSDACADNASQRVVYLPGVGSGKLKTTLTTAINKIGGGAFGWGLARNVKRAYAEVCKHYEDGDAIYIFGFSRGAYTARSLAGMIRKCGIIPADQLGTFKLARAWALYKSAGERNHPDSDHIWKARLGLSPRVATSDTDLARRDAGSHIVNIAYLGVWDTVGALGVPEGLFGPIAKLWNWRYTFHDTDLSSLVKSARHAVALDEQRVFFEPALWGNLTGAAGLNKGKTGDDRPYQQIWFIGSHSIVGGSSDTRGLVSFPLDWVTAGAVEHGLVLDPDATLPDHPGDALAQTIELTDPGFVYKVAPHLRAWRDGPDDPRDCHWSVGARVRGLAREYRPGTISRVLAALSVTPPPANDATTPRRRQA